jgi:hypothetical protein
MKRYGILDSNGVLSFIYATSAQKVREVADKNNDSVKAIYPVT